MTDVYHRRCAALLLLLWICGCLVHSTSAAVDAITRKGKYLYKPNGDRFYIKGIAYQESVASATQTAESLAQGGYPEPDSFVDPLAQSDQCKRDVAQLKTLGVNALRIYSVNASLNHDACMKTFDDAGMYVMIDLALPYNGSINRAAPTWDTALFSLYQQTASAFFKYPNVLAFNVANEVVTFDNNTDTLPFIRAATRDMRAFLKAKKQDRILLGYSAADAPAGPMGRRSLVAHYLTCEDSSSLDIFGLNSYAWVGQSSASQAGYDQLIKDFADLAVPAYFSEFGGVPINDPDARPWTEVAAIYQSPMTDVFSGGVAFTYFPKDANAGGKDYSLTTKQGDAYVPRKNFDALAQQFAAVNGPAKPPTTAATNSNRQCPSPSHTFLASANLPPTPSFDRCACAEQTAWSCVVKPALQNEPITIGGMLNTVCNAPGTNFSCMPIASNGSTGVYGDWSSCSPAQRLDWALTAYYAIQNMSPNACNFGGNTTLVQLPAADSNVSRALDTCISKDPISNTFNSSANDGKASSTSTSAASASALVSASLLVFASMLCALVLL